MKTHTAQEIQEKIDDLETIREALRESQSTLERYKSCVEHPDAPYNQEHASGLIQEGKNAMRTKWI